MGGLLPNLPFKVSFRPQRSRERISETTVYELTPLGLTKAGEFRMEGPKGEVMEALRANGPSTISEIVQALAAAGTPQSHEKVKRILRAYFHVYFERGKTFE